jgi:hypothetical protein
MVRTTCDDATVSAYASRSGKELSVILINKDPRIARNVRLSLAGFNPQTRAEVSVLDAKRKDTKIRDFKGISADFNVKLAPYSVTAMTMIDHDSIVPPVNLAALASASASSYSTIGPYFKPVAAIDGKLFTRWNSAAWTKSNGQEAQWFQLSWKKPHTVKRVKIAWGETYAVAYQLLGSNDGKKWKPLHEVTAGTGGTDEYDIAPTTVRYLRIDGKKGTKGISAYSIREIEVFGE